MMRLLLKGSTMFGSSSLGRRLSPLNQISEIKDYLFLSGIAVIKPDPIKNLGISTIINATTEENTPHVKGVDIIRIRVDDHPSANLAIHFHAIADKIKAVKEAGGRVLVHCMAGVSRSASLILAYLVKYERMTLRQAYFYVRSVRPIIHPNLGFWKQLVDYERRLRGYPSVSLIPTRLSSMPLPDVYAEEIRDAKNKDDREERKERKEREEGKERTAKVLLSSSPSSLINTKPSAPSPLSSSSYRSNTLSPSLSRVIPISRSTPSSLSRLPLSPLGYSRYTPRLTTHSLI